MAKTKGPVSAAPEMAAAAGPSAAPLDGVKLTRFRDELVRLDRECCSHEQERHEISARIIEKRRRMDAIRKEISEMIFGAPGEYQ
jgi:hypothetical protein